MPILTSNTICRQTADTLLAASTFLEVMSVWKNNDPEITSKTKFAKYHALRIVKAIKATGKKQIIVAGITTDVTVQVP